MSLESQARQRVAECKANIVHIDSQIRDLERLRERDRATIAALQVVLSPIAHLPCELLMEIFQIYLTVEPFSCWDVEVPFKDMLALTQVCAYWRKIVLTTPLLWVQKMFPLRLDGKAGNFSREATKVFLRAIHTTADFRSADRWRALNLTLPSLHMLTEIPAGTLKALETVSLRSKGSHSWCPKINAFLTAPLLHTVELDVRDAERFPMPWSQLTCLTIYDTPQTCMATIALCSNLPLGHNIHPELATIRASVHCHIQRVDNDLLRALRYRQSDSELVPKLETLWFEYITAAFDEEELEEVIASRWSTGTSMPTPARLKEVQYSDGLEKIFTRRFLDEMDRYRFEGLKVDGMFEPEDAEDDS
ncbi:hypothetical protein B0H16DRAFT_1823786 [Mycena metata]|uniref:F-box domain-containing protein n=1 Tax=Mycena metata TaxID=1033252 RepID=A0AAD7J5E9_9AGAR|nr:hypothetical protein B0H16DRAFT_1823786 [Mycena metata]